MPRFNEIINNFINGEVGPKLYGRTDSEIYRRSCRSIENMIVHPQGGASRRVGTQFVLDWLYNDDLINENARIIPFIYSKEEKYLVIFPAEYTNYMNQGYPCVIYNIQTQKFTQPFFNGGSAAGWNYDSIGKGTSVSANELTDATLLKEMQYAQNGSVMIFAHRDIPPFQITRVANGTFVASDFYRPYNNQIEAAPGTSDLTWTRWPYRDMNITGTTITPGATTGTAIAFTASADIFTADMVGTPFVIQNSGTVGAAYITGFTDAQNITANIEQDMPGTSPYTGWAFSAWSKRYGYPRSVAFTSDQRSIFGYTNSEPEKLWFSQTADVFEYSNDRLIDPGEPTTDDDPGSFTLFSTEANEGNWITSNGRNILAGTRGREYSISNLSGVGSPPAEARPQTSYGSEAIQPVIVDDVPIFVQRGFRRLREMAFDFRTEGYAAADTTYLHDTLFSKSQDVLGQQSISEIKYMSYQPLSNNIVWICDNNGYLYGLTRSREGEVNAFHRHELGGVEGTTFPKVLSIASVPSKNGTFDETYLLVKRTIDGSSKVFLEKIGKEFITPSLHTDEETREGQPYFLDACKIFRPKDMNFLARLYDTNTADVADGSPAPTVSGFFTFDRQLEFTGNNSYHEYQGLDNADFPQVGCIRFKVAGDPQPNPFINDLICVSKDSGDTDNMILITSAVNASGTIDINLTINDSTGTPIINNVTVGQIAEFNPVGTVIELDYDLTAGETRIFVDGVQLGSTLTDTGTRDTDIAILRINSDPNLTNSWSGMKYSDVTVFDTVQNTADHEVFEEQHLSTTIRDLEYLEGETVGILADGNYIGTKTVASGQITLDDSYSTVIVGFKYTHSLEIQPVDLGTGIGSAMGSIKRIDRAVLRFNSSAACKVGPSLSDLEELIFRVPETPMGDPVELVTDDKKVDFRGGYDRQARLVISHDVPLPCNLTCLSLRGITADV